MLNKPSLFLIWKLGSFLASSAAEPGEETAAQPEMTIWNIHADAKLTFINASPKPCT